MFEIDKYVSAGAGGGGGSTQWVQYPNQNNIFGKVTTPKTSNDAVKYLGTFKSTTACFAACNATKSCEDWTFHDPKFQDPNWAGGCYYTVNGEWGPQPEQMVTSARGPHVPSGYFKFGAGGNQGGEGNEGAGEWWVEGLQEDLDNVNEFWYDEVSRQLYFMPNGTDVSL